MSPLFGKKKVSAKTVLILDIENGSLATALVHVSPNELPKLLAEKRAMLPVQQTLQSGALLKETLALSQLLLTRASEVAVRMRARSGKAATLGEVSEVMVFLGTPWVSFTVSDIGEHKAAALHVLTVALRQQVQSLFGDVTTTFHAFSSVAAQAVHDASSEDSCLLCIVSGETSELVTVCDGNIVTQATFPVGQRLLERTLRLHGGLTSEETGSALKLGESSHLREAFEAAGEHFATAFRDSAADMLQAAPVHDVLVFSHEPHGEWFAQTLALSPKIADLFAEGGVVRAARATHFLPLVVAHSAQPDLFLVTEAIFVDSSCGV